MNKVYVGLLAIGLIAAPIAPAASASPQENAYLDAIDAQLPKVSQQIDSTVLLNFAMAVCDELYVGTPLATVNDHAVTQFTTRGWPRDTAIKMVSLAHQYRCPETVAR